MCEDAAQDGLGKTDRAATGPVRLSLEPRRQRPCVPPELQPSFNTMGTTLICMTHMVATTMRWHALKSSTDHKHQLQTYLEELDTEYVVDDPQSRP